MLAAAAFVAVRAFDSNEAAGAPAATQAQSTAPGTTPATATAEPPPPTTSAPAVEVADKPKRAKPSDRGELALRETIGGEISPKSVVASGTGRFVAQNMMYRHTVTVYDRSGKLVATIPDTVDWRKLGYPKYAGATYQGAPVEAAFTPDGAVRLRLQLLDVRRRLRARRIGRCGPGQYDDSFVYRIDMASLEIDRGDQGRGGAEVRGGDARREPRPRDELVLVRR